MTNEHTVSLPTTEGTEDEILAALWSLCYDTMRGVDTDAVLTAIQHIQDGNSCVRVARELYEVVDPPWSVEQDVYGCEKGRGCTDATPDQRAHFELMIARLESGDACDRSEPEVTGTSNSGEPAEGEPEDGNEDEDEDVDQQPPAPEAEG